MSTRILNGIKISDVSSLAKVLAFAEDIRTVIRDEIHAHRAQAIKMMACVIYDMYHSAGKDMVNPVEDDTRIQTDISSGDRQYHAAHAVLKVQPHYEIKLEEEAGLRCS